MPKVSSGQRDMSINSVGSITWDLLLYRVFIFVPKKLKWTTAAATIKKKIRKRKQNEACITFPGNSILETCLS